MQAKSELPRLRSELETGSAPISEASELVETDDIFAETAARLFTPLHAARKEIRLLDVHPGVDDAIIQCSILYASLLEHPPLVYETVSYCWGDPKTRAVIEVDGVDLDVPATCAETLRRMRRHDKHRVLWIDAVCINQNNVEEKGRQVAFMGEIYHKAFCNLIWLGEEDSSTKEALMTIHLLHEDARRETNNFETLAETAYDEFGAYVICTTSLEVRFEATPLLEFFNRPWFHRLWVVQEAALSKRSICHCGQLEVELTEILRTAQWLFYKQRFLDFQILSSRGMVNASRVWEFADHEYGWLHSTTENKTKEFRPLLHALRDFDAQDPRDHVFGVLGLYQALVGIATLPRALLPDYGRDPSEVLESCTRLAMEERGDLDVLSSLLHWPSEVNELSLPSWVPRWHRPVINNSDALRLAFFFRADGNVPLDRWLLVSYSDSSILSVAGIVVATISSFTDAIKASQIDDSRELSQLVKRMTIMAEDPSAPLSSVGPNTCLATTLVAGRNRGRRPFTEQDMPDYYEFLEQIHDPGSYSQEIEAGSEYLATQLQDSPNATRFRQAFRDACTDRCFFVTDSGHIGLGPSTTQRGDIVTVLYGSRWPVILRGEGSRHEMLGVGYVCNIMNGEAVGLHRQFESDDFIFHIK
jgi:hypothetical protein